MTGDKTPANPYLLTYADLQWQEGDTPFASDYQDIYFSKQQGLEETRHVFLHHNQLETRWRQLATSEQPAKRFIIGETGFGTGLNFLAAWQLWRQIAPAGWRLHFISTEKHPLQLEDLKRSLAAWPELAPLSQQLIEQYPVLVPGQHSLSFDDGVTLQLLLGDATEGLQQLSTGAISSVQPGNWQVDAWFLDGFAPAKNPSLWHSGLYRQIARLSAPGTTIATFTAVGDVRRGLIDCGFAMQKVKGFGHKREMLCGMFNAPTPSTESQPLQDTPWYLPAVTTPSPAKHVAVIGGGLAGAHTAWALAQRGVTVTLIETASELATGASGNPQGMLYTKLSPQAGLLNQFTLASYLHALRHYRLLAKRVAQPLLNFCGVLQLACNDKDQQLLTALQTTFAHLPELVRFVDAEDASALAGVSLPHPGWYYPAAGWAVPPAICRQLALQERIELCLGQRVARLQTTAEGRWQLLDEAGRVISCSDAVVIANSRDALCFEQCQQLPLKTIRGQITAMEATTESSGLRTVICHDGYLTPAINGRHHLGATFDINDSDTSLRSQDHRRNVDSLSCAIPGLFAPPADYAALDGRAGLRCTSPDYLPLVGPAPDYAQFLENYAPLRKNGRQIIAQPGSYFPGLYLNLAHGSRGLTSAPLCAEIIAAMICNEPPPLGETLLRALNPARFIIRDLIRNKI